MIDEYKVDLNCHPSTPLGAVRAIQVLVRRSTSSEIHLTFRVDGDISRIRVPSQGQPRLSTGLWKHTCFEAFLGVGEQEAYHEFNFAPSLEWTVYSFKGYRNGGPVIDEALRPDIVVRSTGSQLELEGAIRLDRLSLVHPRALLRMGLSAVIEASDGFSYWALRHPADRPDFHSTDGFSLVLEPPNPVAS
jgi:hypothetical protein